MRAVERTVIIAILVGELGCIADESNILTSLGTEETNTESSSDFTEIGISSTGELSDGTDSDSESENITSTEKAKPIQFTNLEVGQRSRYQHFYGVNYGDLEKGSFEYTGVILIAEVVEETPEGFLVVESFEPGHEATEDTPGIEHWIEPEKMRFLLQIDGDHLLARPAAAETRSYLFRAFYAGERPLGDNLPLAGIERPEVKIVNWQSDLGYCDCYRSGFLPSFDLLGAHYNSLNVVQNDTAMASDGPGYTHVYSRDNGILRRTWVELWGLEGGGWDLIPD